MNQSKQIRTLAIEPAAQAPRRLLQWVLVVAFCLATTLLAACDPGSSDGGIDPGIIEIPVAYIKRPIPLDDMGNEAHFDMRAPLLFSGGGDVYLRSSSTENATTVNLTSSVTLGTGDVKGLNANHEGNKLVFSLRLADPDPNDDIEPPWNIYEYDLETDTLRLVMPPASASLGNDLYPSYLPDGRIVFTSDRQKGAQEMLLTEIKPGFAALDESEGVRALVLHVMNADGTNIRQISYNMSHDLYPQVLTNYDPGKIVFSRWDNAEDNGEFVLYTVNPDGSDLEILYGARSHDTGTNGANIQFTNLRETEDGDLMVITKPFTDTFDGGDIVRIDVSRYVDNNKAIWSLNSLTGPAQETVTVSNVDNTAQAISVNGRYGTAFPLWDGSNRILVSKSTCQLDVNGTIRPCVDPYLSDPAAVEASPNYAIWLYDEDVDTEKPIVLAESGQVITEAITVEERERAPVIFDRSLTGDLDPILEADLLGIVNIKSVYDMGDGTFDGCYFGFCTGAAGITSVQDLANPALATASQRPARFVRFTRPVSLPDPDDPGLMNPPDLDGDAFGLSRDRGMREIVGYAPVEPDGSVKVIVPANIPLAVEVLDGEGRRIGPRHTNWFQLQPGDEITCVGCHDVANGGNPPEVHARNDGEAPSINSGTPGNTLVNTLIPGQISPYPYPATPGQTWAEVRFTSNGLVDPPVPAATTRLSADLVLVDYWTDPAVNTPDPAPANMPVVYSYAMLDPTIPRPTNTFCSPVWLHNCRVTINYPDHIHALFQLDRGPDAFTVDAPMNPSPADPTNTPLQTTPVADGIGDWTCIACHTTMNGTRLPYGQLDLTTDPNQNPNDRFRSYSQMFQNKDALTFDGVNLVPFDPNVNVAPSMRLAGARGSYFMEKMTGTELNAGRTILSSFDHSVMMTPHELKMIGEWLDIGGQNFNNPFDPDAPQN